MEIDFVANFCEPLEMVVAIEIRRSPDISIGRTRYITDGSMEA